MLDSELDEEFVDAVAEEMVSLINTTIRSSSRRWALSDWVPHRLHPVLGHRRGPGDVRASPCQRLR